MRLSRGIRRRLVGAFVGLTAIGFVDGVVRGLSFEPLVRIEGVLTDFRHILWVEIFGAGPDDPPAPVVVVDIDERSLAELGPYGPSWRRYHADVVRELAANHAGAVVFDVLFKNSDSGRAEFAAVENAFSASSIPFLTDSFHRDALRQALDPGTQLERAVADAPRVVAAAQLEVAGNYPNRSDWIGRATDGWRASIHRGVPLDSTVLAILPGGHVLDGIYPGLAKAARRTGLANVRPDRDGSFRRVPLLWRFPDTNLIDSVLAPHGLSPQVALPVLSLQGASLLLGRGEREFVMHPGDVIRLGSPVRVWRDPAGGLATSAPGFTGPMLEDLRAAAGRINDLERQQTGVMRTGSETILERRADGRLVTLLGWPDTLDHAASTSLSALAGDTLWWSQVPPPGEGPLAVSDSVFVEQTETGFRIHSFERPPEGDDQPASVVDVSRRALGILLTELPRVLPGGGGDLLPEGSVLLSTPIEVWWDPVRRRLASHIPALRGSSLRDLLDVSDSALAALNPGDTLALGEPMELPVDRTGSFLLPFYSYARWADRTAERSFIRHVSYVDVVRGRVDPGWIRGRAFVLGSSAAALSDFVRTPVGDRYPGVVLQATALLALVHGDGLRLPPMSQRHAAVWGLGLAATILALAVSPLVALGGLLLLWAGWFGATLLAFDHGVWHEILPPILGAAAAVISILGVRYLFEEREKKFLYAAFGSYLAPELIDRMVERGEQPRLGGENRTITAFFTDIQSFSSFSEILPSQDLVTLLNEYLQEQTRILLHEQGCLDKYIGDAIVGIFGAPAEVPDHPRRALRAAVAMQECLSALRARWTSQGDRWPELVHQMRMRIGLNTGPATVGNMGSSLRMNYTMMGDTVNLAARLESSAKHYGSYILATGETVKECGDEFLIRRIDLLRVVGKSRPVEVFEVIDAADRARPEAVECARRFGQALDRWIAGDFPAALQGFEASEPLEPLRGQPGVRTTPSLVFTARCRALLAHPPVQWDGVYTATEK